MNWEELVTLLEKEIQNARYRHIAPSGWETMGYDKYFLDIRTKDKEFEIRYSPSEVKNYSENNIFYGWIWIEAYDLTKGRFFNHRYQIAFIRPQYHSEDGAIIMPEEYSLRIKKSIVDKVKNDSERKLESISI